MSTLDPKTDSCCTLGGTHEWLRVYDSRVRATDIERCSYCDRERSLNPKTGDAMKSAMVALAGLAHGYGLAAWWAIGNPCAWMWGALCLALATWMPDRKPDAS